MAELPYRALQPEEESSSSLSDIKESQEWRILAYSANKEQSDHHMSLLCGIIGKQIPPSDLKKAAFQFQKNRVRVTVHFGSHADCKVTYEDVDLMLFFTAVNSDCQIIDRSSIALIEQISESRGAMIWKHSVAILTGVDVIIDTIGWLNPQVSTRQGILLKTCTSQIQEALELALGNHVNPTDVLIIPTGRQDRPDLPKPHAKWFTQLWHGCFLTSNKKSSAALLKVAQERISYRVPNYSIKKVPFHEQPIEVEKRGLFQKRKNDTALTSINKLLP